MLKLRAAVLLCCAAGAAGERRVLFASKPTGCSAEAGCSGFGPPDPAADRHHVGELLHHIVNGGSTPTFPGAGRGFTRSTRKSDLSAGVPNATVSGCGAQPTTGLTAPSPAATALQNDLNAAASRGDRLFVVPPGSYCFNSHILLLRGARDLIVDASGATFWFTYGGSLSIESCANVEWLGGVVDYDPPVYAQGYVTSTAQAGQGVWEAAFDPAYPLPDTSVGVFNYYATGNTKVAIFDPTTGQMRRSSDNAANAAINIWLQTSTALGYTAGDGGGACSPAVSILTSGRTGLQGTIGGEWCYGIPETATASFDPTAQAACEGYYIDPCCTDQTDPTAYLTGSCVGGCAACSYVEKSDGSWHCASGAEVVYGCPFALYKLATTGSGYLLTADPPQVGDPIAVFPRGYPHAVMVVACANVTLRGVAAYGSTNMGVLETGGQGGNTYVDSRVIPRPHSGHLISVNADGFHAVGSAIGPSVQQADVQFTGDDLLNITPRIMMVLAVNGDQLTVLDPGSHTSLLSTGDTLSIYQPPTGTESISSLYVGAVTLAAAPAATGQAEAQAVIDETEPGCATVTGSQTASYFQTKNVYTLTLDKAADFGVAICDLIQDVSKASYAPVVANSTFSSSYARAALIKCDAQVLSTSTFGNSGGMWAGIETQWLEGSLAFGSTPAQLANLLDVALGSPWLNFQQGSGCSDLVLSGSTAEGVCPVAQ